MCSGAWAAKRIVRLDPGKGVAVSVSVSHSWDGNNPRGDNYGNYSENLILNPKGGVVLVAQLTELLGNPNCITPPNCWDFGIWMVSPSGATIWKIRQDFNNSSWGAPRAAVFDNNGALIVVGGTALNDGGGDDFQDNHDWVIAKFRVP